MKDKETYYPLEDNYNKIRELFGKEFLEKSINGTLTKEEVLKANEKLAIYLYGEEIAKCVKERNINKLDEMFEEMKYKTKKNIFIENLDFDSIGMVIIRPETMGEIEKYKSFLESLKLKLVLENKKKITFEQYWRLYHHGLRHKDSVIDFPTRTFNYIDNELDILIYTGDKEELNTSSISEFISNHKGTMGKKKESTLRGMIAYDSLSKYLQSPNKLILKANVPLDPIGAYRMLVNDEVESDGIHNNVDSPILFYAGQGVHVPNRDEIENDLQTVCDEEDIRKVMVKINGNNI